MLFRKHIFVFSGWTLLYCLIGIVDVMLFTDSATAQDTMNKVGQELVIKKGFGFNFSARFVNDGIGNTFLSQSEIFSPEDDNMPYPILFFNVRYDAYETNIAWADDQNENILRFTVRYNHYGKNMYVYGGPVFWRWTKKFNFTRYFCGEYSIQSTPLSPQCVEGTEMSVELETDRPNGKSIWFGISSGLGVEYKLLGLIWSHEIEVYFTPCKYEDFICAGGDIKFWGIHFPF